MFGSVLNSSNFWLAYLSSAVVAMGGIYGIFTGLHKKFVKRVSETVMNELSAKMPEDFKGAVESIVHELTPNGGGSIKDSVNRLEVSIFEQRQVLNDINITLQRHLGFHDGLELIDARP
jgi:hypothetical protein